MRVHRGAALGAATLLLAACGGAGGSGADLDDLPELALEETFRLGSVDDPDVGFSSIGTVTVGPDGTVYVFESRDMEVRRFDARGTLLGAFGRRGEGPGEFRRPSALGVTGDSLWALEYGGFGTTRLSFFSPEGQHLATHAVNASIAIPMGGDYVGGLGPTRWRNDRTLEGGVSVFMRGGPMAADVEQPEPGDSVRVPRVRFDLEGNVLDTIGYLPSPLTLDAPEAPTVKVEGRDLRVPMVPTRPRPRVATLDDALLLMEGWVPEGPDDAVVRVTRLGLAGDTIYHRELAYTPEPWTEAALDTLALRNSRSDIPQVTIVDGVIQRAAPPEDPDAFQAAAFRAIRSAMDVPTYPPPVQSNFTGEDGSLFLKWADRGSLQDRWLVLDPDGEPRGWITLPRWASLRWASGDEFITVEDDDFDVPWLVKYRLGR